MTIRALRVKHVVFHHKDWNSLSKETLPKFMRGFFKQLRTLQRLHEDLLCVVLGELDFPILRLKRIALPPSNHAFG